MAIATVALHPALQLGPLRGLDRGHLLFSEPGLVHHGTVDHLHAALADGAEGQLGMQRHTELAHQQHIKWRVQGFGYLEGHRDTASRQTQHHNVLTT